MKPLLLFALLGAGTAFAGWPWASLFAWLIAIFCAMCAGANAVKEEH